MDKKLLELEKNVIVAITNDKGNHEAIDAFLSFILKKLEPMLSGISRISAPFFLAVLENACEVIKENFKGIEEVAEEMKKLITPVLINVDELNKQSGTYKE